MAVRPEELPPTITPTVEAPQEAIPAASYLELVPPLTEVGALEQPEAGAGLPG